MSMSKQITSEEFERIVAAYLGGRLRAGDVPIGAKLVPGELRGELVKRLADKGFALSFSARKDEEALLVATLQARPEDVIEAHEDSVESVKEG
jgi:hypothetical protein